MRSFFAFILLAVSIPASAQNYNVKSEWRPAFDAAYKLLEANLRRPGRRNPYYHAHPAPLYPGVYLWDSAFISLIWKHHNPAIAKDVVRAVLHRQFPDGRIPQVVSILGPNNNGLSNPPVLSYAAMQIAEHSRDVEFAKSVYPKLRFFHQWLWKNRRLSNGLFFWAMPYESGIDNSARFSNRDESHTISTTNIAATDLSSYAVLDCESLAELAKMQLSVLPAGSQEAAILRAHILDYGLKADQVTELMRRHLWDETSGYFYDRNVTTGQLLKVRTISSLVPLLAGVPTEAQWLRMREHITNPAEFNTPIPLVTVARNDPTFEKDSWRGPIWINTAYMVIKGVKRYGDEALTRNLSERLVDGVYNTWEVTGDFLEFYDPERYDTVELSRKKGLGPLGLSGSRDPKKVLSHLILKQIILGKKPVGRFMGWTGLVNTLVIEELQ